MKTLLSLSRFALLFLFVYVYFLPHVDSYFIDRIQEYDCGGILDDGSGFIESPNFPDPYPPNVDCSWEIRADPGNRVQLKSIWFSTEDCPWDRVEIQDGAKGEFGRQVHCGTTEFQFTSTSNVVKVHFRTDASGIDPGFRIKYDQSRGHHVQSCNKTIVHEGVVTSPHYPSPYPNDAICFIVIQAPDRHRIQLVFTDFEMETWPCDFDRLDVLNKDGNGALTLLQSFCGRDLPPVYTSYGHMVILKFVSDDSVRSKGFSANINFLSDVTTTPSTTTSTASSSTSAIRGQEVPVMGGCNQTVSAFQFDISSPSYPSPYPHDMHCTTTIRGDAKSTFVIKFLNFSVEEADNCTYDSLSIYGADEEKNPDGQESRTLLRRMCGALFDDVIISWEGYTLDLVFYSDRSVNDAGYIANVVVTPIVETPRCPDVCKNGGSCAETLLPDGSVDWVCLCTDDYSGVFCEIPSPQSCASITCRNGGSCQKGSPSAVCICPNGFRGIHCEQVLTMSEKGALYFTKMSGNMSLSVGSTAILECAVNDEKASVMWLFHDRILANSDWSRGVEVHPGGVVIIREATDALSGRYTCMALTPGDLIEKSVWITLIEPCSLEVSKGPSNMTVQEGQPVLFQCYVPEADVTHWRKDGDLVTQGPRKRLLVNHYLVINPVVETDAGQYTCAARGANGCFSKTSAYLNVQRTGHGKECGRARNPSTEATMVGRISSGREATRGSAPWHVILREHKKDTTFCGGSLVSPDTVLTAAHCVTHFESTFGYPFHPRHIQIYIGTHHCVGHNGIYRQLKWYKLHEEFNNTHYNNDLAVFKLDRPVDYSDDVMPICLERPAFVEELMKPGRLGVITGCGDRQAQVMPPKFLHEVQIPIVARDVCRERASIVNTSFTEGMFCAGYARSMRGDACTGDSGGAFTLQFHERSILVGIVSWGVGCDLENHYGYYTQVAHYYDWIMDKLERD